MAGRPLKSLDSPIVNAYLDPEVARRTRTYAQESGRSLSSLVNEALILFFRRLDAIEEIDHDAVHARLEALSRAAIAAERGQI